MKVVTIIFCILTIIMLVALAISIINHDDKSTSNKEKRYTLIYITSFIFLMISSITFTLKLDVIGLIFFIIFILLVALATVIFISVRKSLNSKKKTLVPNKLKDNLTVVKDSRDGYTYNVKAKLTCCNCSDFKVEEIRKDKLIIINCICNKCNTKYEVFNSELDGYNLQNNDDVKIINDSFKEHKCVFKMNSYKLDIKYEYIDEMEEIKELKKIGINDLSNIYTSIKISLSCNECDKKEKEYLKNEFK